MVTVRRTVTMHDVALEAGVSIATVSRVVNGRYGVGAETAKRVRAAIRDLGYESSLVATSLRSERTNVIAVVCLSFELFTAEVLHGVTRAVRGSGFDLMVHINDETQKSDRWEQRQVSRLSGTLADGCVVVTPFGEVVSSTPVVAVDPCVGSRMHSVEAENDVGANAAVEHLLALGHRRIGFIGGRRSLDAACSREHSYRLALERAGVTVDPDLVRGGDFHYEGAIPAIRELLALDDPPTAVFAANDAMALALIDIATELGFRIPTDLSVVGFDNIPQSGLSRPPLTTVDQHPRDMGYEAGKLLLRLIQEPDTAVTRVTVPTDLVVRDSTCPPPDRRHHKGGRATASATATSGASMVPPERAVSTARRSSVTSASRTPLP